MKVTAFSGSPRKNSNSRRILDAFLKGAETAGAEISLYETDKLDIKPCTGCLVCNVKKKCIIKNDEWETLSSEILASDLLVFATPVYFHHMTASMKKILDRFRSFITVQITRDGILHTPHIAWSKKFHLITAMGSSSDEDAGPLVDLFNFITSNFGEGNSFTFQNSTRLAVAGQLDLNASRLKALYRMMKIPEDLAQPDYERNLKILKDAEETGYKLATE